MTVTVTKKSYEKLKPKIKNYRDYKNFLNDTFRKVLLEKLSIENINANGSGFENFLQICIQMLDIFAPYKKKYLRGRNMPFMNKSLARAHMTRSRLRNLYLKKKTEITKLAYIKQRNYVFLSREKLKKIIMRTLKKKTSQIMSNSGGQ